MRPVLLLLLAIVAYASAAKWRELQSHEKHLYSFDDFKAEYNRKYTNEVEESFRRKLFQSSLHRINRHNQDPSKTWKTGINKFSDMTEQEKKAFRGVNGALLAKQKSAAKRSLPRPLDLDNNSSAFAGVNVDWRTKGVVTKVKDQGGCGSCWTFSTAETIESYYALKTNNLVVLSEQQILDCTPNPNDCGGNGGCGGGTVELAVARIMVMGGLSLESSYPYVSGDGSNFQCDTTKVKPAVRVANYFDLPSNQLNPVLQHVATNGPISISVDASTWSDYESGIFDGCDNKNPDIDHAVQLVGYGTDPSLGDYWLVRNSWSDGWGEDGYVRLKRYATPPCGTDTTPGDGDGCNGGPSEVTVCGNCGILFDTTYVQIQ
jgi:cathepsin L